MAWLKYAKCTGGGEIYDKREHDGHRVAGVGMQSLNSNKPPFRLSCFFGWRSFFVEPPVPLDDCSKSIWLPLFFQVLRPYLMRYPIWIKLANDAVA